MANTGTSKMLLIFAPERAASSLGISTGKERAAGVGGGEKIRKGWKKNIFPSLETKFWAKAFPGAAGWLWLGGWQALAGSLGRDIDLIIALNTKPVLTVLN